MNDLERQEWVRNDEGLYTWHKDSKLSMKIFLKKNRHEIDTIINNIMGNKKPAHYLIYPFSIEE